MKTLGSKIAYVEKWLKEGKAITNRLSVNRFNYFRLADGIYKLKNKGMWIINIGKPGKYAKYIMVDRGLIHNIIPLGFRLNIISAHYIDGLADMEIYIIANNGVRSVQFTCNSDAFRDKSIMENKLKEALK